METNKKKKKTVGYIRNSSANGDSVEIQKALLREYCQKRSFKIGKFFVDLGYSGMDLDRPALQKMLKEVSSGNVERIVCTATDRLTRDWRDASLMERLFVTNNISFSFLSGECYYDLYRDDLKDLCHFRKSKFLIETILGERYPLRNRMVSSCGKKVSTKKPNTKRRYRHNSNVDRSHQG